jgi:hypothetical protein
MNGFLVMLSCTIDDVPIRLCATEEEALTSLVGRNFEDGLTAEEEAAWGLDQSGPVCFAIIEFRNGVPVSRKV